VGSAAVASQPSAPARSATQAQERLASFQRGIRNARAAALGDRNQGEEDGDVTRESDLSPPPELCLPAA
jgi:hypothetical protein